MARPRAIAGVTSSLLAGFLLLCCHRVPAAPTAAAVPSPAGQYVLATIDGHALPYAPDHPGRPADAPPPPQVTEGLFVVQPDSTFQMTMGYRMGGDVVRRTFNGRYVPQAGGFSASWSNAGQTPITLRGDTLVLDNEGMLFAYVRRAAPRP